MFLLQSCSPPRECSPTEYIRQKYKHFNNGKYTISILPHPLLHGPQIEKVLWYYNIITLSNLTQNLKLHIGFYYQNKQTNKPTWISSTNKAWCNKVVEQKIYLGFPWFLEGLTEVTHVNFLDTCIPENCKCPLSYFIFKNYWGAWVAQLSWVHNVNHLG